MKNKIQEILLEPDRTTVGVTVHVKVKVFIDKSRYIKTENNNNLNTENLEELKTEG